MDLIDCLDELEKDIALLKEKLRRKILERDYIEKSTIGFKEHKRRSLLRRANKIKY